MTKRIEDLEDLKTYLKEYKKTYSNATDEVFGLFESDVYSWAKEYVDDTAEVYDLDEFVDERKEIIKTELDCSEPDYDLIKHTLKDLENIEYNLTFRFFLENSDGQWIGVK